MSAGTPETDVIRKHRKEEIRDEELRNRKYGYRAAAVLAAITMAGTMPLTSFAASGKRPNVSKPDDAHTVAEPPAPDINKDISPEFAYSRTNGHPSGIMCWNSGS